MSSRPSIPAGVLFKAIDPDRIIGCIAYPAATIAEPGVIKHIEGTRFPVGELDGSESPRVQRVAELLTESGFKARVLTDIRSEIWLKLWGNLTFNPISALTHSTLVDICQFPLTPFAGRGDDDRGADHRRNASGPVSA